ncbi:M50 family metallopeptidase [Cellulomonas fimi]|uniref:Peptidase M50 n=1 Tax=Cellulomonas fimi (strain ATCC 484 / DSM 20113 / JCM 1341 / CCUG 24087 / LMG 16345 / NBRC 15513 / NCIMB 8980 / NCTC 7547 / NRS-133) TaxID=590998 RepID=F4H724_CELFA|nr:site-2 protease family protein [Cellulomonas fimi]AEE45658.1 peptidase M50 [Cellulomonas fimi ATCC 484]NNH08048.1 site-2 protease family protein [Cellulomonas fimi]VEH30206.1 Metalloprotease mmpA [Cellulomonas fimi]
MAYLLGVLVFVVVLLASIALHEVGHMVPAKRFGVRVSHYMVGFGPTLWSRTKGETEYGLKAIPLGGFVRLVGMYAPDEAVGNPPARTWLGRLARDARQASAEEIRPGEDHRAFYRLSTPKKLVVMLGGPVMNLVIAVVLLGVALSAIGAPTGTSTTLQAVYACVLPSDAPADRTCTDADEPAPGAAAGMRPGDTVVRYDGTDVTSWAQLTELIRASGDQEVPVVVERDGARVDLTVTPVVADRPQLDDAGEAVLGPDGEPVMTRVGFLGVQPMMALERTPVLEVPGVVAERTWQTITVVATLPARVVDLVQSTFGSQERGVDSIVGVVGIGRFAGEIGAYEGLGDLGLEVKVVSWLEMLAMLNVALFVFNLIPLPPLDGGHVAAALWEGARRQVARLRGLPRPGPSDSARLVPLAYAVFVLLGAVGLLLVYADIVNPVTI